MANPKDVMSGVKFKDFTQRKTAPARVLGEPMMQERVVPTSQDPIKKKLQDARKSK